MLIADGATKAADGATKVPRELSRKLVSQLRSLLDMLLVERAEESSDGSFKKVKEVQLLTAIVVIFDFRA